MVASELVVANEGLAVVGVSVEQNKGLMVVENE